ncbi:MAG: chemotaxis protein CheW [Pararobbsia sp.]
MDMLELADKLESLPASTDAEGAHTANAAVAAPPDEIAARQALGLAGRTLPGETAVSRRAAHAAAEGFAEALASGEGSTDVLASSNRVADALASSLYGTFFLARVELALPVEAIQEVVTFPARVTTIPLAPAFLIGVFNLRGTIVPVIRLATLLGMTGQDGADADARTSKVAIVDLDGLRVGLVFDTTGDMLRVPAADRHAFRYTHDAPHPVIQGALKLAGGERIVQVLDPAALLRIEQVPRILDKQRASGPRRHSALAQRRQCVSFRLGCTALAFEIGAIHEIIRVPVVQASVLRSEHCVGMFTLRGNVMPLVDFGALLGMPRADAAAEVAGMADERRIIVMRLGERHVGLLVDRVDSIVGFAAHDVLPIPTLGLRRGAMFAGWIGRASIDDIVLLKHDAVLASAELAALTQGHSHLYASDDAQGAKQRARGERQVFITFRLDNLMAAPIADIREIIRHPDEILTPRACRRPCTACSTCGAVS